MTYLTGNMNYYNSLEKKQKCCGREEKEEKSLNKEKSNRKMKLDIKKEKLLIKKCIII